VVTEKQGTTRKIGEPHKLKSKHLVAGGLHWICEIRPWQGACFCCCCYCCKLQLPRCYQRACVACTCSLNLHVASGSTEAQPWHAPCIAWLEKMFDAS
jgi:hypothetical protein